MDFLDLQSNQSQASVLTAMPLSANALLVQSLGGIEGFKPWLAVMRGASLSIRAMGDGPGLRPPELGPFISSCNDQWQSCVGPHAVAKLCRSTCSGKAVWVHMQWQSCVGPHAVWHPVDAGAPCNARSSLPGQCLLDSACLTVPA